MRARPIRYEVGEQVWVKNRTLSSAIKGISGKLAPNYTKCRIQRKIGTNCYEVEELSKKSLGIFYSTQIALKDKDVKRNVNFGSIQLTHCTNPIGSYIAHNDF